MPLPLLVAVAVLFPMQPPFNTEARAKAGFDESWYLPLVAQ
jgi:uncharacterized ferritin-like protein (DUF455 family)